MTPYDPGAILQRGGTGNGKSPEIAG